METMNPGNRTRWVGGIVLIALGVLFLVTQVTGIRLGDLTAVVIMAGICVTFLAVYLTNRANWWALIPAYVFAAIAGIITLDMLRVGQVFGVDFTAIFVLSAIALPFIVVYALNRRNWWALIPAYVMLAIIGIIVLDQSWITRGMSDDLVGAFVMFAIALPFLFVYLRNTENWWALIPGGIMLTIGLGLAISAFQYVIPAALILGGLFLIVRQMSRSSAPAVGMPEAPKTGPAADHGPEQFEAVGTRETGPSADHE